MSVMQRPFERHIEGVPSDCNPQHAESFVPDEQAESAAASVMPSGYQHWTVAEENSRMNMTAWRVNKKETIASPARVKSKSDD